MKIVISADQGSKMLKYRIKGALEERRHTVEDVSAPDVFDATMNVVHAMQKRTADVGIVIDAYGVAPFMIANKNSGIICAAVYEDYTSKMTRRHNHTGIIALGSAITAECLSCELALNFVASQYDGGRHQARVDMLNKML